jgi:hypothetical protein
MVKHERNSGDVSPVPANLSVPVIRQGRLIKDGAGQKLDTPIQTALLRVADPADLLRAPVADTVNYGFLQSTDTQKALFLTPAFEIGKKQLFSKTPPLFVDAFRIVNSNQSSRISATPRATSAMRSRSSLTAPSFRRDF